MASFENPEKVSPVPINEIGEEKINKEEGGKEMKTEEELKWQETIDKAIAFSEKSPAVDVFGIVNEKGMSKKELEEYKEIKGALGNDVFEYLMSGQVGSISGGGNLPEKLATAEERARQEEYERIKNLPPEELRQEAEKYMAEIRKEMEDAKKGEIKK